jgi:hypothetical protein
MFILSWRFFTGDFMNARRWNDSTFFHDASNWRKRQKTSPRKYTWWKRKSRLKRMALRNVIFWPTLLLTIGFIWDWSSMLIILGFLGFPVMFMLEPKTHLWHRARLLVQNPAVGHHNGKVTQSWTWKTSILHAQRKVHTPKGERWHPGIATKAELAGEPKIEKLTPDMERAVRAELAEELSPGGPIELRLLLDPGTDFAD